MKKRDVELKLSGEVQKAVWSLMWSRKKMKSLEISRKIGRPQTSVIRVLDYLVSEGALIPPVKGVYEISHEVIK